MFNEIGTSMVFISNTDCIQVLRKLGIDPAIRVFPYDQDAQYTSCRLDELEDYFQLYRKPDTSESEKHVLCCFMLECLNESISMGIDHPLEKEILETLIRNETLHEEELDYWTNTDDPDESNWWPIAKTLLKYHQ